mgnify:FL=1
MHRRDEERDEANDRRSRGTTLRLVGAGLASVLAIGVPIDGSGGVKAGGPTVVTPTRLPGFTTLPAGWPDPAPELKGALQEDVWAMVYASCRRYGITDQALAMYQVLWEESRLTSKVRSGCGRYHGISQFTPYTFRRNVEAMRRLGLIWGDERWSPFDPSQAIEVMAWMWSQGHQDHWGPYRRVIRRLATARAAERLN